MLPPEQSLFKLAANRLKFYKKFKKWKLSHMMNFLSDHGVASKPKDQNFSATTIQKQFGDDLWIFQYN